MTTTRKELLELATVPIDRLPLEVIPHYLLYYGVLNTVDSEKLGDIVYYTSSTCSEIFNKFIDGYFEETEINDQLQLYFELRRLIINLKLETNERVTKFEIGYDRYKYTLMFLFYNGRTKKTIEALETIIRNKENALKETNKNFIELADKMPGVKQFVRKCANETEEKFKDVLSLYDEAETLRELYIITLDNWDDTELYDDLKKNTLTEFKLFCIECLKYANAFNTVIDIIQDSQGVSYLEEFKQDIERYTDGLNGINRLTELANETAEKKLSKVSTPSLKPNKEMIEEARNFLESAFSCGGFEYTKKFENMVISILCKGELKTLRW